MNKVITDPFELTPIEKHNGLLFKRDDLFIPYEINSVNGGKLRQCIMLIQSCARDKHIYTYSSLDSPQSPIVASVCQHMQLDCTVYYGGTNEISAMKHHMPRITKYYNATIDYSCKSGRHSVLHSTIKKIIGEEDFLVEYGINLEKHSDVLLTAVSNQCQNLPDYLSTLNVVCGSGITAAGILIGLKRYNKEVDIINLIATAPDRHDLIYKLTKPYNINYNLIFHDLFHMPNFEYTKKEQFSFDNIQLHPNYEAKALKFLLENENLDDNSLFWIVGSYPTIDFL